MSLTTLSCFVGLGLATACSGPSVPSLSPVLLPAMPSTQPRAKGAASQAEPDTLPARPAPASPRAKARVTAALLHNVCQMGALPNPSIGVPSFGCACCAPCDGCKPSDPPVAIDQAVYFPTQAVSGVFTSAGADQRALPMAGCEPHSENYGGMVLLERGPDGFLFHRYVNGLSADQCWPLRRDDGRVSAAYLARCNELQEAPADAPIVAKRRPRASLAGHTERVTFRSDGTKFVRR